MNGCVHNVDAILKRAEVAEAKVKALEAQVETLEARAEAQRTKAAAEMEKLRGSIDTSYRNFSGYNFENEFTMQTLANKIAQCARAGKEPVEGWNRVYAVLKGVHSDWVKKYSNEPEDFHWYYGHLLSTAYSSGAYFHKNQRENINKWLWSYWKWVANDDYGDYGDYGRA